MVVLVIVGVRVSRISLCYTPVRVIVAVLVARSGHGFGSDPFRRTSGRVADDGRGKLLLGQAALKKMLLVTVYLSDLLFSRGSCWFLASLLLVPLRLLVGLPYCFYFRVGLLRAWLPWWPLRVDLLYLGPFVPTLGRKCLVLGR